MRLTARVSAATRVPHGAGRACSRRDARDAASVSSTATTSCPQEGDPVAGGHGQVPAARSALPEPAPPTSRCSISARPWLPRDLGAAPAPRAATWHPGRRQPGRRRLSGLGGRRDRRAQRPLPPRAARRRPRALPEPVQQGVIRSLPRRAAGCVGDPLQRRRRRSVHAGGERRRRTVRSSCSAATRRRRTGSSSRCGRSPRVLEAEPAARAARHRAARVSRASRCSTSSGCETVSSSSAGTRSAMRRELMRRAHLLLHTKVKDPCPSAVIEAMACGLPVVYPASGGTVELVGDEAGDRRAASRELGARRASVAGGARRCSSARCSPNALGLCRGGPNSRRRAVRAGAVARSPRGALRPAPRADASTQISPQPSFGSPMSQPRFGELARAGASGVVLDLVLRVGEVRQPDLTAKRHGPVTVERPARG